MAFFTRSLIGSPFSHMRESCKLSDCLPALIR